MSLVAAADDSLVADLRRRRLVSWFARGCEAVDGQRRVRATLGSRTVPARWHLVAIGKAAVPMAQGALDAWGETFAGGIAVAPAAGADAERPAQWPEALQLLRASHPVPDERSVAAGEALLRFSASLPPNEPVLLLVSGGASALVEALPSGLSLDFLQRLNQWALASGVPIGDLNALRRRVSRLKDGRLVAALGPSRVTALVLSDVPGDDPALVGSGIACRATPAKVDETAAGEPALRLPDDLRQALRAAQSVEATLPAGAVPAELVLVGGLDDALAAVQRAATAEGLRVSRIPGRCSGEAVSIASRMAHELMFTGADVVLWGGETTVTLPPHPGIGGRNQHLALAAARLLAGHEDAVLLVAGTDGIDGNSVDAGAIIDGGTIARGRAAGLDAGEALAHADAGSFLEATGDLLHTGPTSTNVGDLLIGLRGRADAVPEGEAP